MHKIKIDENIKFDEKIYSTILKNGLKVYIYKKEGFKQKIGLFGTRYGSLDNEFVDINTQKKVKVPDGVAHFLEHKLFEQEGANALDLFSKIGVSSNAYTSFDQTVFYFETIERFEESMGLLIKLVKTPYFTDKNVQKEQGIIGQEINMYKDDANYMTYFNMLKAMYINNPVKIDIAGSIDSISHITKDVLYTCYNTFYNPSNMFLIVIGDVDIEDTINLIEENIKMYEKEYDTSKVNDQIVKFIVDEPDSIKQNQVEEKMDIYMPELCIGYKLNVVKHSEIIKRQVICDMISEMYFSKLSQFFKDEYEKGLLNGTINFDSEFSNTFFHVIISTESIKIDELKKDILEYMETLKSKEINEELFNLAKTKILGNELLESDNVTIQYRKIIESILFETSPYEYLEDLDTLTKEDIKKFLNLLTKEKQVISTVLPK